MLSFHMLIHAGSKAGTSKGPMDPPLHSTEAMNLTSTRAFHGAKGMYPNMYKAAVEAGKAHRYPNMNFTSA